MKKTSTFLLIFIAVSMILSACSSNSVSATAVPESTQPQGLIAEGRLLPANSLDQYFQSPGRVAEVMVKDGDSVSAGQPLARLVDLPDADAALARAQQEVLAAQQALDDLKSSPDLTLAKSRLAVVQAQSALDKAQEAVDNDATDENKALLEVAGAVLKQTEDRLAVLESAGGIDPDQMAAAEARLASAQAALAAAQAAANSRVLTAALDGTVVDLSLQAGQQVSTAAPALVIADLSSWVVETDNLTESEVVNISLGQQVEVVLDALPSRTLTGEVTHINARFEEKRGDITYSVTIRLAEADPQMRWGMTAAVHFLP